jgi:sensor histidine kinase YesM
MTLPKAFSLENISNLFLRFRWPWHLGFWFFYAVSRGVVYYITLRYYKQNFLEFMLITELFFAVLVYLTLWIYRYFFGKKQYKLYFLVSLIVWFIYLFLVVSFQKYYLQDVPSIAETGASDIMLNAATKYFFTFVLLTMAKYFKDNYIRQYQENQQRQLQIQSELQHLKAQISPHFLFNTMNNFYGLAVEKSDKLPELMVRLSELLRYSLYETKNVTVPIQQEIAYLRDYIELEKIRLEDSLDFTFDVSIEPDSKVEIAPLLLVVFVENAFKHAKNVTKEVIRINITLSLDKDDTFCFEVKNNCLTLEKNNPTSHGIGLQNVKKRLEVLYPYGMHNLHIEQKNDTFEVKLSIKLHKLQ